MSLATQKYFNLAEYHHLIEIGFFQEDERIELIRGNISQMIAKGTSHTVCCTKLNKELSQLLANHAILRCQDPILLPLNSEPEPDFAIVKNRDDDYLSSHPTPDDILFIIEIADSSLNYDQEVKLPLYAEAGIEQYWIINLLEQQLEVYTHPYQKYSQGFDYRHKSIFLSNQTVNLPGFSDLVLDLSKIFP
jgi:Uma2 family endonuclease